MSDDAPTFRGVKYPAYLQQHDQNREGKKEWFERIEASVKERQSPAAEQITKLLENRAKIKPALFRKRNRKGACKGAWIPRA